VFGVEFVVEDEYKNELGKKIVVYFKNDKPVHSLFGILLLEDNAQIKLELKDGTIFTIEKDKISRHRLFKEVKNANSAVES